MDRMPIHFNNTNSIWASVLVETLYRLGLKTAIVCPGSRSAPLTVALALHPDIEAIPVLDERSAAFYALGIAKRTGIPVALVCTSGTAGANFYGAVIEARESRVPLLILTADRPAELRECNAGQTIDQQKLYGAYPNWYSELTVPALDRSLLAYLRQTVIHAWERTLAPVAGCVHLNVPFRDPLAPIPQPEAEALKQEFNEGDFFSGLEIQPPAPSGVPLSIPSDWFQADRGILIAGVAQPQSPQIYCEAIAHLARLLGVPVLAEGLSPVRNYASLNPHLISTYDLILRNPDLAEKLTPDFVVRVGEMPTSKTLRQWLDRTQPRQWIVDPGDRNLDPLHLKTTYLRTSVEQIASSLSGQVASPETQYLSNSALNFVDPPASGTSLSKGGREAQALTKRYCSRTYLQEWCAAEQQVRHNLDRTFEQMEQLFEGKVAWLLSKYLPEHTPLFIANSTPVRDVEWFWQPGDRKIQPYFNRGANGIDGTLSTALGMAHRQQSSVLLTGDLALLHDTNGFLLRQKFVGHLTIVLINNQGGGIFGMLPIAQFEPPFEEFFATPQDIDFAQLSATYGIEHIAIESWTHLIQLLKPLPAAGVRLLEVQCDRRVDAQWRRKYLEQLSRLDLQER